MRKLIPFLTVAMAVGLMFLVVACSGNQNRTSTNRSQSGMNDSDMEKRVQQQLKSDPQLNAFDIKVDADKDSKELKLSGTVNSEELRRRAVQIAQSSLPGYSISDTIDVKPRELARSEENDNQNGTRNQENKNKMDRNGQRNFNQNQSGSDYNRDMNNRDLDQQHQNQNQTPSPAR